MIGRVNVGGGGEVGPTYTIKKWCATVGYDYANLDDIPETAMRILMTKYASVAYFLEWCSADNSMIDAFIANQYAMKWIGLRDYICDKLMNYGTINLLKPTLETTTTNGVTCTNNGDGTYTVNGTASAETFFYLATGVNIKANSKFICSPNGASGTTFRSAIGGVGYEYGDGLICSDDKDGAWFRIEMKSGTVCNNLRFKPMLTTNLSATYSDFIQYGHSEIGDKMLGSEYWEYILKDHVPIMTSDSAPYGEVIGTPSTQSATDYPKLQIWTCFDGIDSESDRAFWQISKITFPVYLGYHFTNPICVKKFALMNRDSKSSPKNITLQGSNNGLTYDDIESYVNGNTASEKTTFDVENDNYYLYYRIAITSMNDSTYAYLNVVTLQFFGRSLNVSVPTMTSNTSPYGEVKTSSAYTSDGTTYAGYMAFDGIHTSTVATNWCSNLEHDTSPWIYYDFKKPIVATRATMLRHDGHRSLKGKFQASNTGNDGDWVDLTDEVTIYYTASGAYNYAGHLYGMEFEFNTDHVAYKMYKFQVTDGNTVSSAITQIARLQFFGVDYSERTDRTYLCDNGVEIVPMTSSGYSWSAWSMSSAIKEANDILLKTTSSDVMSIIGIANAIDLTRYSLLKFILAENVSVISTNCAITASSGLDAGATRIAIKNPVNFGGVDCLDISAINQSCYLSAQISKIIGSVKLLEMWLE